ncbi:MAG: acyltransferase family protein [Acidimicrobiia bacterium]
MADPASTSGAAVEQAPPARPHFPCLDAYRAIGMMMVIVFHADFASLAHDKGILGQIIKRFDLSLAFFFVLSAFLLFRPYAVSQLSGRPPMPIRKFYRHRVLRIFPGYWFALLGLVVVFGLRFENFGDLLTYVFILQTYTGKVFDPQYQMIYQAWSLATELAFYLVLPLFALWVRRRTVARPVNDQLRFLLVACGCAFVFGVAFRIFMVSTTPSWQESGILSLPCWLDFFAIGVALATISAWMECTARDFTVLGWLGRHPAWSWVMAGVVYFGSTRYQPGTQPLKLHGVEYVTRYLLYSVVAVLFLAPGMFGNQEQGLIRRGLRSKLLVYLGTVSLGFYLFHVAIMERVQEWFGFKPFEASFTRLLLVAVPLSVVAASISYYVVERSFLRMKRESFRVAWSKTRWARIAHR